MLLAAPSRLLAIRHTITVQLHRNSMKLTFAAASKMFYFNADVHQIDVPTFSGSFGILAFHVPTLAVVRPGLVTVVQKDAKRKTYFVSSGIVTVNEDGTVQVLVEEAYKPKYIDYAECRQLLSKYSQRRDQAKNALEREIANVAVDCAAELIKAEHA